MSKGFLGRSFSGSARAILENSDVAGISEDFLVVAWPSANTSHILTRRYCADTIY